MTAGRGSREQLQSSAELTPDSLSLGHYRLHTHAHRSCVKEANQWFLFGRVSCTTPARASAVHDLTIPYIVSNSPDEFWCVLHAGKIDTHSTIPALHIRAAARTGDPPTAGNHHTVRCKWCLCEGHSKIGTGTQSSRSNPNPRQHTSTLLYQQHPHRKDATPCVCCILSVSMCWRPLCFLVRDGPDNDAVLRGEGDCVAEPQWDLPWCQLKRVALEQAYQCDLGLLQGGTPFESLHSDKGQHS